MDDENNTPSETPESEDDVSGYGGILPTPPIAPSPSGPTAKSSPTDPAVPEPPPPIPTPPIGGGTTDPKEPSAW